MTIDSADDSKISNRTINTNRISNRTYDSKWNRITKLRRSLLLNLSKDEERADANTGYLPSTSVFPSQLGLTSAPSLGIDSSLP